MLLRVLAVGAIGLGGIFGLLAIIVVAQAPVIDSRLIGSVYAGVFAVLVYTGARLWLAARQSKDVRRHGFAVETKAAGATPLPPGEVDAKRSGADGEGGRQLAPEHHGGIV